MANFEDMLVEAQNKMNTLNVYTEKRGRIQTLITQFSQPVSDNPFVMLGLTGILLDEDIQNMSNTVVENLNVALAEVESKIAELIGAGI